MSEFIKNIKYLCEVAKDLNEATVEKLLKVSNIKENIERLKQDILNHKALASQRTISYIILNNIHTSMSLKDIELYMTYIQKNDDEKLAELINDNKLFEHIKEQIKSYSKNNPFQNWTAQSIVSHTYYFIKYDNSKIKKIVENIAESFKSKLPNSEKFSINANSFYVSRLKNYSWFVLYPKNNKKYNHKKFALLQMSFHDGTIEYGLGRGDEFEGSIDKHLQVRKKVEDLQPNTFDEIVDFYNKILPKYESLNNKAMEISPKKNDREEGQTTMPKQSQPLNQILYGPPGTGKTYHTINKAIEIIDNDFFQTHKGEIPENRKALKEKFEAYRQAGQIEFVTFHQSYGYEEFVEGIKADLKSEDIKYKLEHGIFKTLSNKAQLDYALSYIKDKFPLELKTSTGKTFSILSSTESSLILETSKNTEQDIRIVDLYILLKNFNQDVHNASYAKPCFEYLMNINEKANTSAKNHILIIDEINRGNISKIFGELITLIEESKRIGKEEALHVKLPYSGEPFGVPSNLYIIGTMNTADRSIALMDTALRRRFDFTEMMPCPELLENVFVEDINIKLLLETINKRIEYLYDRDHTIGHAYFMSLKEKVKDENGGLREKTEAEKKAELDNIFKNKIIPLLQEYFYDDWEKILMVLGIDGFVEKQEVSENIFTYKNGEYFEDKQYTYTIKKEFDFSEFKNK